VRWHVAEAKEPTWAWAQPGGAEMGIVIEASENGEEKPLESSFHCLPVEKRKFTLDKTTLSNQCQCNSRPTFDDPGAQ
jgi:hypothetical protein